MPSYKDHFLVTTGNYPSSIEGSHIYYEHMTSAPLESVQKIKHVIFHHSLMGRIEAYEELFLSLKKAFGDHLVISACDMTGFGRSGGPRGHIESFDNLISDTHRFYEICREEIHQEKEVETYIIAHGLGALISLKTLFLEEKEKVLIPNKVVFSSPLFGIKSKILQAPLLRSWHVLGMLSEVNLPLPFNAYNMTCDETRAQEILQDLLIPKTLSLNFIKELLESIRLVNTFSYFMEIPTLFLLAEDDILADLEKTDLFMTGMKKEFVDSCLYSGARHDILNDTCRFEAFEAIISYLKN